MTSQNHTITKLNKTVLYPTNTTYYCLNLNNITTIPNKSSPYNYRTLQYLTSQIHNNTSNYVTNTILYCSKQYFTPLYMHYTVLNLATTLQLPNFSRLGITRPHNYFTRRNQTSPNNYTTTPQNPTSPNLTITIHCNSHLNNTITLRYETRLHPTSQSLKTTLKAFHTKDNT